MKYVVVGTSHFGYEAVQTILKNKYFTKLFIIGNIFSYLIKR